LTGGIACGKSTVVKLLQQRLGEQLAVFDCDRCVAQLLADATHASRLAEIFGAEILLGAGQGVNRRVLGELVFANPPLRKQLENYLHPLVREACLAEYKHLQTKPQLLAYLIDIPLYYETGSSYPADFVVVVGCSPAVQRRRLQERNNFSEEHISRILQAQWSVEEKMRHADLVIWNELPLASLDFQVEKLITYFKHARINTEKTRS